jgi:hypothetical protein
MDGPSLVRDSSVDDFNSKFSELQITINQYIKLSRISLLNSGGSVLSGWLCSEF